MKKIVPSPYIDQTERWVNGCESISSVMLLQAVGIDIDRIPSLPATCPTLLTGSRTENSTARTRGRSTPATPTTTPATAAIRPASSRP